MLARTSSIALIAALAATLAAALAADARAASPALEPARFSLTIDGVEIAQLSALTGISSRTAVLGRGTTRGPALLAWHQSVVEGQIAAKDASIVMYDTAGEPVATWDLENAWPSKIEIDGLSSGSNEVAIESITLAHEGFEIR
jgi:hypothetical protein